MVLALKYHFRLWWNIKKQLKSNFSLTKPNKPATINVNYLPASFTVLGHKLLLLTSAMVCVQFISFLKCERSDGSGSQYYPGAHSDLPLDIYAIAGIYYTRSLQTWGTVQHCWPSNFAPCWRKNLSGFKLKLTSSNIIQHGVQTRPTCCIQQCCTNMLALFKQTEFFSLTLITM